MRRHELLSTLSNVYSWIVNTLFVWTRTALAKKNENLISQRHLEHRCSTFWGWSLGMLLLHPNFWSQFSREKNSTEYRFSFSNNCNQRKGSNRHVSMENLHAVENAKLLLSHFAIRCHRVSTKRCGFCITIKQQRTLAHRFLMSVM